MKQQVESIAHFRRTTRGAPYWSLAPLLQRCSERCATAVLRLNATCQEGEALRRLIDALAPRKRTSATAPKRDDEGSFDTTGALGAVPSQNGLVRSELMWILDIGSLIIAASDSRDYAIHLDRDAAAVAAPPDSRVEKRLALRFRGKRQLDLVGAL